MTIDWLTVVAQIINFLILVYLLKRFLYQPVLTAMDNRERLIAAQLSEAELREKEADEKERQYQSKLDSLQARQDELISQAMEKAEDKAGDFLEQTRQDIMDKRLQWQRELEAERETFLNSVKKHGCQALIHIAKQVLQDLSSRSLERQIVDVLVNKLGNLNEEQKQALALEGAPVHIVTTFALNNNLRRELTAVLQQLVPQREPVFKESPELLCGIEIRGRGQKICWSVADYIHNLEQAMESAFYTNRTVSS